MNFCRVDTQWQVWVHIQQTHFDVLDPIGHQAGEEILTFAGHALGADGGIELCF